MSTGKCFVVEALIQFFNIIFSGLFKFSDSFMAMTSDLLAVAVKAMTGTEGKVEHNIANRE